MRASAPGKLLLTGEYAVLEGAPALVAAVDRRVHVGIETVPAERGRLTARPLELVDAPTSIIDGRLACRNPVADGSEPTSIVDLGLSGRFLPLALAALGRPPAESATLVLDIDSRALYRSADGSAVKLGLGSSAAVSAALSVCLEAIYADSPDAGCDARLQRWLPVYRDALDGYASGADLAACFHGGLLVYRNVDGPVARSLRWPSGLYWQPVWVGRPAQTADFVARFRAWQAGAGSASARRLADLGVLARQAVDAAGSASALIEAARAYAQAIRSLGEAMDCAIETPPHQRLAALAARLGTMYKSCGAGGGDIGVALDRDPDRLAAFATRAASVGAVPVDLTIDAGGAGLARPEPRCSAD